MEQQENQPQGIKDPSHKAHTIAAFVILVLVAAAIGAGAWYYLATFGQDNASWQSIVNPKKNEKKTETATNTANSTNTSAALTNDQIYQEVATQFSLSRGTIVYFRIFGQDKVTYAIKGTAPIATIGANYVYKQNGKWQVAQANAQSAPLCSALTNVPEGYRPPCFEGDNLKYVDSQRGSLNYPISQAVSYIGE